MLLFLSPTATYYYLGHIAIQDTSDAHLEGVFQLFTS